MSIYVKEELGEKIIPHLMKQAIDEVLIEAGAEKLLDNTYKIQGWHGNIYYDIQDEKLTYTVDSWRKEKEWNELKRKITVNYTSKVYSKAAQKAGWRHISKRKEGNKVVLFAR